MNKFNIGVIFAISIQIATFTWFLSSQNSKIEELYKFYEEESAKDVIENQVKMKLDLEHVMAELKTIKKDLKKSKNKDKEIMEQHNQIFELLKDKQEVPSGYSYGD